MGVTHYLSPVTLCKCAEECPDFPPSTTFYKSGAGLLLNALKLVYHNLMPESITLLFRPFQRIARLIYLVAIAALLLFFVPSALFPLQSAKLALFSTLFAAAALLYALGGGVRNFFALRGSCIVLAVFALPLLYLVSALFSQEPFLFLGSSIEADTPAFALLAALSLVLAFYAFRTPQGARSLLSATLAVIAAAALLQTLLLFGGADFLGVSNTFSAAGKWNDFGLLVALGALLAALRAELERRSPLFALFASLAALAATALLVLVNFPLAWALLFAGSIAGGFLVWLARRGEPPQGRISLLFFGMGILSLVGLVFGAWLNLRLTGLLPLSSLEVRPSPQSTFAVASADGASAKKILIGDGPGTFGRQWLMHKPPEVNQSIFWNVDFAVGYSTLSTAFASVGALGVLAWLSPLALLAFGLAAFYRKKVFSGLEPREQAALAGLVFGTLFLFAALLWYVPSSPLLLLAFMFGGGALSLVFRHALGERALSLPPFFASASAAAGAAVLVLCLLSFAAAADRRAVSEAYVSKSFAALAEGGLERALAFAERAQAAEDTLAARSAKFAVLQRQLENMAQEKEPAQEVVREFSARAAEAAALGRSMIADYPTLYRPLLQLARLYEFLGGLGVEGATAAAREALSRAAALNPTNPEIALLQARLEANVGDAAAAERHLAEALALKPNYTDAILGVVRLAIAKNDLGVARSGARMAAQLEPDAAALWFQLGLLEYAAGDANAAAAALERAVALVPEYANAKYYLGLSYARLGRPAEALRQFEDLSASNPDNAEVSLILANLRAGKDPFEGAAPPVTRNPERRETAPIPE